MKEGHLGDALHAYLDNELTVERVLEARSHLAACQSCRGEFQKMRELRDVLRRTLVPTEPPAAFLRQLKRSIHRAEPDHFRRQMKWVALVAPPLAAVALLLLFIRSSAPPPPAIDLTGDVVAAHLRSLQAQHLTDVASSDRHTVKPWFQGKLPFSPPVRDFTDQGYALQGGRLDYLGGQPVAALVYRAGEHIINVFVWPAATQNSTPRYETRSGLSVLDWVENGMAWWVVSDAHEVELERLASLLREPPH